MSKQYDSFEEAIEKSELVGIIAYTTFIINAVFISGFFGIPRYIVTEHNESFMYGWNPWLKYPVRLLMFFFSTIFGTISYIFVNFLFIVQGGYRGPNVEGKIENMDTIEAFKNITTIKKYEYESTKDFLSMILFATWVIFLYRMILKYKAFQEYIEETE